MQACHGWWCNTVLWHANPFSLSSRRRKHARKACWTSKLAVYECLTGDVRLTIIQDEGYWRFWIEVELIMACSCSRFNPYCLLTQLTLLHGADNTVLVGPRISVRRRPDDFLLVGPSLTAVMGQWGADDGPTSCYSWRKHVDIGPIALYRWCQLVHRRPKMSWELYTDDVSLSTEGRWWAESFIPMMSVCPQKADDVLTGLYRWCQHVDRRPVVCWQLNGYHTDVVSRQFTGI